MRPLYNELSLYLDEAQEALGEHQMSLAADLVRKVCRGLPQVTCNLSEELTSTLVRAIEGA